MKRIILLFTLALAAFACTPKGVRTGDLLFVGIPENYRISGTMTDAIADATSGGKSLNIIHTAIIEVCDGYTWIIDATLKHGVDRHPLDTFLRDFTLRDGSYPELIVMRLRDTAGVHQYVRNAKKYIGLSYNNSFVPCDTARYCTELVRDSYVRPDGEHIFSEAPMNFLAPDGTMPKYWEELFAILGRPVPQGVPGTNPRSMMEEKCLRKVDAKLLP